MKYFVYAAPIRSIFPILIYYPYNETSIIHFL